MHWLIILLFTSVLSFGDINPTYAQMTDDELEDAIEDAEDDLEDAIEDAEDELEDMEDDIEDALDDLEDDLDDIEG
jgi:ElaB/YqjD/DUF883 family membrane-anchored ribosome-binding protein